MSLINRFMRTALKFFTVIIFAFIALGAFAAPPAGVLDDTHAAVRAVMAVQGEITPTLMQQPEILGTAVGVDAGGAPVLTVYVDRDAATAGEAIRRLARAVGVIGVHIRPT